MKRLVLAAFLALLATPGLAVARDKEGDRNGRHRHVRAVEMAGVGMGAAVLLGAAGYLALRRRRAA
jgi:MYXO-CTERM domain-containing protein